MDKNVPKEASRPVPTYSLIAGNEESILEEAQRLTHGPRNEAYGHPADDYTRTAALMSALLAHKLSSPITAQEATLLMCCVKLSRQINSPKRDNMVDLAGYAWCTQAIIDRDEQKQNVK